MHIALQRKFKQLVEAMFESNAFILEPATESGISDYTTLYNAVDSLDNPDHIGLTDEYFRASFSSPNGWLSLLLRL